MVLVGKRTGACDHCGKVAKLRHALYVAQRYCGPCWERFGGRHKRTNRAAARRRALGQ